MKNYLGENCPGEFDLNVPKDDIFLLLNNRVKLFNTPSHFFLDGYGIDNDLLSSALLVGEFAKEINAIINNGNGRITLIPYFDGKIKEDGGISLVIIGSGFHFTCHTFCYKNTAFIDCFSNENCEEKLLPIIIKFFKVKEFDLCKNNSEIMGNFGKHLIINNCKKSYTDSIKLVEDILKEIKMTAIYDLITNYVDENSFDIIQPIAESHISIHCINGNLTIDVFSCKKFDDNKVLNLISDNSSCINSYIVNRGIKYQI